MTTDSRSASVIGSSTQISLFVSPAGAAANPLSQPIQSRVCLRSSTRLPKSTKTAFDCRMLLPILAAFAGPAE